MNLLQAFKFLDMVTEDLDSYQKEYKEYVVAHKDRVRQFAEWLKDQLPELFTENNIDMDLFNEMIQEHDDSKFGEEEFEAYAQHFYGNNSDNDFEFNEAWKHHWMHNEHHPEFWLGEDMPYIYILEMICDWGSFSIESGDFNELLDFYYNKARNDEEKNLSGNTKVIIEEILSEIKKVTDSSSPASSTIEESYSNTLLKQKQLEIILDTNPAQDDYHTWIRTIDDILTFEEALNHSDYIDYKGEDFDESYPYSIAEAALKSNSIKVYSSYKILPGVFVTPSKLEASSYAGSTKKLFSKEVKLTDVAWIDPTQGMYVGSIK